MTKISHNFIDLTGQVFGRLTIIKREANNRRDSLYLTFQGEKRTIAEWAKIVKLPYTLLFHRAKKNWPVEKIFSSHRSNRWEAMKFMDESQ